MLDPESIDGLEDESVRERRRDVAWRDLLGRHPPAYQSEGLAPPLSPEQRMGLLRADRLGELSREESLRVAMLVQQFRSWARASAELTAEMIRDQGEDRRRDGSAG